MTALVYLALALAALSCVLVTQDIKEFGWTYVFCLVWPGHAFFGLGVAQYLIWPQPEATRLPLVLGVIIVSALCIVGFFFFDAEAALRKR